MSGLDLDRMITQLLNCEILTEREVKLLCDKAIEILVEESNVQTVAAPVRCPPACAALLAAKPSTWRGGSWVTWGGSIGCYERVADPATRTRRLLVRAASLASEAAAGATVDASTDGLERGCVGCMGR
jgi:hypothetical protein